MKADYHCSLSIAEMGVSIKSNEPALIEKLHHRYHAFATNDNIDNKIQLIINISLSGRLRTTALLDTGTIFKDGLLHFTAPGYQGNIDLIAGQAELSISSACPVEEIDYCLRVAYALLAFEAGGVMFHSAGIARRGQTYLFFGHSGSGKSTVSRLSAEDNIVLNDDLVLLMPHNQGWMVYATPFWNPTQVRPTAHNAPLVAMFRLVQDKKVYLQKMGAGQAIAEIVSNVPVIPIDATLSIELLQRSQKLIQSTNIYNLHFLPDLSFWDVVDTV